VASPPERFRVAILRGLDSERRALVAVGAAEVTVPLQEHSACELAGFAATAQRLLDTRGRIAVAGVGGV
jgi:hypothetical protein